MISRQELLERDQADELAFCRDRFSIPEGTVYLDGNSLGVLPKQVVSSVSDVVIHQWGVDLISSWNKHGWIEMAQRVGDGIGALIGAAPGQVVCTDSISVNLFKVLGAAKSLQPDRRVVLSTVDNFPTDLYMVQGLSRLLGEHEIELQLVEEGELVDHINESVMAIMLSHVNFRTGALLDMLDLTKRAHHAGALAIWDLAHSAGALEVELDACHVDFAVGCTYKYLNAGPGAPAFVYCNQAIVQQVTQPLSGWMGHAFAFEFDSNYTPDAGIKKFLCGTPPIVSMACVEAALSAFDGVSMHAIRAKSIALSETFEALLRDHGLLQLLTPVHSADPHTRGSQLAYASDHAYGLCQSLIERGVVPDFRAPNYIRFGFTPLYTSFDDVWKAVEHIVQAIENEEHMHPRWREKLAVT